LTAYNKRTAVPTSAMQRTLNSLK